MAVAQRRLQETINAKATTEAAPIQRAVDTNGGTFDTTEYKPFEDYSGETAYVGANIRLTFLPNPTIIDTDANTIGLVQTVKTMQQIGENAPQPWSPDNKGQLGLKMTREEGHPGMGIDKRDKEDYNQGLTPVSPVYAEQAGYDQNSDKISAQVAPMGGDKTYFGKNWVRNQFRDPAELVDRPRSPRYPKTSWKADFEVAALVLDGVHEGSYLGSVNWGWETNVGGKPKVVPPAITLARNGTPTTDFQAAGMKWNKVMGLSPKHEDVDILADWTREKKDSKKGVERKVRLLPDFLEDKEAPRFAELPSDQLIEVYKKLKSEKLFLNEKQQSLELTLVIRILLGRWQSMEGMTLRKLIPEESDLAKDLKKAGQVAEEAENQRNIETAKKDLRDLVQEWNKDQNIDYLIKAYVQGFKRSGISGEQITVFLMEYAQGNAVKNQAEFLKKIQGYFDEKVQDKQPAKTVTKGDTGDYSIDDL